MLDVRVERGVPDMKEGGLAVTRCEPISEGFP